MFLDPNTFSEDGTTSLGALNFSENGKIAAYSISEGGSDWRKIIVMDVASKMIKEDTFIDVILFINGKKDLTLKVNKE